MGHSRSVQSLAYGPIPTHATVSSLPQGSLQILKFSGRGAVTALIVAPLLSIFLHLWGPQWAR